MRTSIAVAAFTVLSACAEEPSPTAPAVPPVAATSSPAPNEPPANADATSLTAEQKAKDAARVPIATAFLEAYTDSSPRLSRSGTVVFVSSRDGLPQLYAADAAKPNEPARRLPTPKERTFSPTLTADDKSVLFISDQNADGDFAIFSVGLDGKNLKNLTPDERLHRARPLVAAGKPDVIAYSAHAAKSEKTGVYLQRLDGSKPREVYADPRGGYLTDLSRDATHGLFVRENADNDEVVFDVDLGTGKATRVFPPEGAKPQAASAGYDASGARILIATHAEGRPAELLALDRKSGKEVGRYEEGALKNADLDVVIPPAADRIAILIDAGNHSELRLLDARTLKLQRSLDLPLGTVGGVAFTADGKRLVFAQSRPDLPPETFVADAATGKIGPLHHEERPALAKMPPLKSAIVDIPSFDGLALPTNVYLPANASGRLPTLVLIHGGPSGSSAVRWNPDVRYWSSLGYAVVEPNIRGSTGFGIAFQKADDKDKRGDALRDVEVVNRWARAQPWCDPDRVIITGTSYGGYMTLLAVARQPTLWRAGVDLSGMSDLRTMERLEDQAIRVYDETEFGILGKEDDLLFAWSPLKYVDAIVAPVFVYQGKNDPITPQNEADQIVKALRARKVPVEYMLLTDEGHGIFRRENRAAFLARAARFLEEHAGPRSK